jgi:pyrimidine operon attenuation protein/uracil phosphoribosyltransferase
MKEVMGSQEIERSLRRMANELLELLGGLEDVVLVGIHSGGHPVAQRLARHMEEVEGKAPLVGEIDITLYRDDLYTGLEKPELGDTRLPRAITGAKLVLVDDVLFTGRTIRAALDELMDFGRPACIKLAVLIDRGHRELPIAADSVGRVLETAKGARVSVEVGAHPGSEDRVRVESGGGEG